MNTATTAATGAASAEQLLFSKQLVGMPIKDAHTALRLSGFQGKIVSARLTDPVPHTLAGPVILLQFEQRNAETNAAGFPVFRVVAAFRLYH